MSLSDSPTWSVECEFRFQHLHPTQPCRLEERNEGKEIHVLLERPLRAITSGQYGVLYQGNVCLGSGKILAPGPSLYELNFLDRGKVSEGFR